MSHPQNHGLIRRYLIAAGALGAVGVLAGAFVAHGLEDFLIQQGHDDIAEKRVSQADVGVRYQLLHAVTLLAVAGVSEFYHPKKLATIVSLLIAGTLLFSGSLYLLVALNLPLLGAVTPVGGLAWIAAWILIAMPSGRGCPNEKPADHVE